VVVDSSMEPDMTQVLFLAGVGAVGPVRDSV
jgi:hypothetical protein